MLCGGMCQPPAQLVPLTVSIDEAARISGLSRGMLNELARQKKLPTTKVGRRILIYFDALQALLKGNAVA